MLHILKKIFFLILLKALFKISYCQYVPPNARLDCFPDPNASEEKCISRGCMWDKVYDGSDKNVPLCYFPQNTGYSLYGKQSDTYILRKNLNSPLNPFSENFENLYVKVSNIGQYLKISISPNTSRYVPPVPLYNSPLPTSESFVFNSQNTSGIFSFTVSRKNDNRILFDTSIGGLFFGDKFIQLATYLPSTNFYGLGENIHHTIKRDFSTYKTWGLFDRDMAPDSKDANRHNLYGVHPFYLVMEPDGKAHGVFFFNSNAQEFVTGPAPHLIYRTIGGQIDMFFFPGPTPEDVIKQYTSLIGKPFLPPLWSLGFQLSRWGYETLDYAKQIIQRNINAGIPLDVIYFDIDYMDRYKDFTIGSSFSDLPEYVKNLKQNYNIKTFLMFDPAIEVDYEVFRRGIEKNASFVSWLYPNLVQRSINDLYPLTKNSSIMLGVVWPDKHVAFPDFLDTTDNTVNWWSYELGHFWDKVNYDGIWIDMNEPSDFSTNEAKVLDTGCIGGNNCLETLKCPLTGPYSEYDNPNYQTYNVYEYGSNTYLSTKTLCMIGSTMNGNGIFYNTKNLYGWSETVATKRGIDNAKKSRGHNDRNVVFSRSTFAGSGNHGGHWLGDNNALWADLKTTVISVQEFNMFGITYVGSDVCGFNGESNEELCLRWQQVGAFHSFYRNHNTLGAAPQDPAQWPTVTSATIKANKFRYKYIPYLYSLHYYSSLQGGTVVKPLFFEFPNDEETYDLGHQFMWGPKFMVIPVITEGMTSVRGYLPDIPEGWYSIYDYNYGLQIPSGYNEFYAPWTYNAPTFIRGGAIIPRLYQSNVTLPRTLHNDHSLLITLDNENSASGEFYFDQDNSEILLTQTTSSFSHFKYQFNCNNTDSTLILTVDKFTTTLLGYSIKNIEIFGYPYQVDYKSFKVDDVTKTVIIGQSSASPFSKILNVTFLDGIASNKYPEVTKNTKTTIYKWKHL
ncbi:Glycoside hydrolase, family 31 and P-type trefoil domain and Galactose mutarotase-like domain and Glycoside hydrolase, superfamily domain-containing protein [Strongyloides ratti]|uniref:Maltase n=1 Tax=Strongyloides ratti TaxID=34506 RepID=A0A090LND2_STRRB|nr:Glycoside hydrolase, family 31 and P-type trefoil domain and Galactose mutarotase-like domain and Glycoside hydrolase, superfamily domain-containing protein [Strongyloides ratti]CEF71375.1 Glycoside hydrolase, family 31 and P-type trefoil domain and Galactose mutarotase-like domain and Glycoside hydrolase, superfamily domain-containing protein [Strongyloides ratti]